MRRLARWLVSTTKGRVVVAALVVAAIPLLWLAWWLGSPLFLDKTVIEEFPRASAGSVPENMTLTRDEVMELTRGVPEEEVARIIEAMEGDGTAMAVTMAGAEAIMEGRAEVDEEAMEQMPADEGGAPVALLSGQFRDADSFHRGQGDATLYRLADGSQLLRFEGLRVTNGPDLRVLLSKHPDPMTRDEFSSAEYVEIEPLKGNIGDQNYELPSGIDGTDYQSVVIYCKPFHVLFSIAPLSAP